jgi:hypothetical protein
MLAVPFTVNPTNLNSINFKLKYDIDKVTAFVNSAACLDKYHMLLCSEESHNTIFQPGKSITTNVDADPKNASLAKEFLADLTKPENGGLTGTFMITDTGSKEAQLVIGVDELKPDLTSEKIIVNDKVNNNVKVYVDNDWVPAAWPIAESSDGKSDSSNMN